MTDHTTHQFHVSARNTLGKASKKLQHLGRLRGNVYGLHAESESIELDQKAFNKAYHKGDELGLIYLDFEGKTKPTPVLITKVDFNPVTDQPTHVSFRRVNLQEKVTVEVPIEIIGEAEIVDANVVPVLSVVEIESLPTDIPEKIEVDISGLTEIGQSILLKDIVPAGAKFNLNVSEEELSSPVVIVQEVKEEVEPEPVVEVAPTAEGEEAPAEGEAPTAESVTKTEDTAD